MKGIIIKFLDPGEVEPTEIFKSRVYFPSIHNSKEEKYVRKIEKGNGPSESKD